MNSTLEQGTSRSPCASLSRCRRPAPRRTCRRRSTLPRAHCRSISISAGLRQGEPGGRADPDARADVEAVPIDRVSRRRATILLQPSFPRSTASAASPMQGNMRPAVRVRVDPARLAAYGIAMEDVRNAVAGGQRQRGERRLRRRRARPIALGANDQLVVGRTPIPRAGHRLAQRRAGARCRTSAACVGGSRTTGSPPGDYPPGARRPVRVVLDIQRQPGANIVQTVRAAEAGAARPAARHAGRASDLSVVTDRTETIRASVADVQITLVLAVRAGGAGDLPVPAAPGAPPSSPPSPCRCRSSAPSA